MSFDYEPYIKMSYDRHICGAAGINYPVRSAA